MDLAERLLIEQLCIRTLARYAVATGDRDIEGFVACFTPDGQWQRPGSPLMKGRSEIRTFIEEVRRPDIALRHVNGTAKIDVIDDRSASGISYTTVYRKENHSSGIASMNGPDYVVEYHDRFEEHGGDWLIDRRDTFLVFRADYATDLPGIPNPARARKV